MHTHDATLWCHLERGFCCVCTIAAIIVLLMQRECPWSAEGRPKDHRHVNYQEGWGVGTEGSAGQGPPPPKTIGGSVGHEPRCSDHPKRLRCLR